VVTGGNSENIFFPDILNVLMKRSGKCKQIVVNNNVSST